MSADPSGRERPGRGAAASKPDRSSRGDVIQKASDACVADEDFSAYIQRLDSAQGRFANESPAEFKKLWSHSDDVTLFGGHGGKVERGWENVAARLDWSSSTYREAKRKSEFIAGCVSGNVAYIVRREFIEACIGDEPLPRRQELRVTMVFRREAEGWRILHRHADSQTEKSV
jgi:ketosteroid isomerase-like protein